MCVYPHQLIYKQGREKTPSKDNKLKSTAVLSTVKAGNSPILSLSTHTHTHIYSSSVQQTGDERRIAGWITE